MSAENYRRNCKRKLLYISKRIEDGHISDYEDEEENFKSKKFFHHRSSGKKDDYCVGQCTSLLQVAKSCDHFFKWPPCEFSDEFGCNKTTVIERLPSWRKKSQNTSSHIFKSSDSKLEEIIPIDSASSNHSDQNFKTPEKNYDESRLHDSIECISTDSTVSKLSHEKNTGIENIDVLSTNSSTTELFKTKNDTLTVDKESELLIALDDSSSQQSDFAKSVYSKNQISIEQNLTIEVISSEDSKAVSLSPSADISQHLSPSTTIATGIKVNKWLETLQWNSSSKEHIQKIHKIYENLENSPEDKICVSLSPPPMDNSTPKVKAVDWLQTFQCKLKTPENFDKRENHYMESNKKKKYLSGGLAECALKLEARLKSAKNIWMHQKSRSAAGQDNSNVLTLKIMHSVSGGGIAICRCKTWHEEYEIQVIHNDDQVKNKSVCSEALLSLKDSSKVFKNSNSIEKVVEKFSKQAESVERNANNKIEVLSRLKNNSVCALADSTYRVLINMDDYVKLKLAYGSIIKIFPPWQQFILSSTTESVIFSPFIEVLEFNIPDDTLVKLANIDQREEVLFRWNCLCRLDLSIHPSHCPAVVIERSSCSKMKVNTETSKFDNISIKSTMKSNKLLKHLSLTLGTNLLQRQTENFQGLILNSVQLLEECAIPFENVRIYGLVQRLLQIPFIKTESTLKIRWWMLLQDAEGMFCEMGSPDMLPFKISETDSCNEVACIEGSAFWFSGIRVIQRLTETSCPSLFAVLRNIHMHQNKRNQKNNEENLLQSFCYILTADHWENTVPSAIKDQLPLYNPPSVEPLKTILLRSSENFRCSFAAKVIWRRKNVLYITDSSLNQCSQDNTFTIESYVKLQLHSNPDVNAKFEMSVIIVVDCKFHEGLLVLDKYSKLEILNPVSSQRKDHKHLNLVSSDNLKSVAKLSLENCLLRKLNKSSSIGDLVKVEGTITDVNEETAYSWLECDLCHSQDLIQESRGAIYCEKCNQRVLNPITRVNLEVILGASEQHKIKLLEATVFNLLPMSIYNSQRPSCAVSDVINKKLGPVICSVEDIQYNQENKLTCIVFNQVA